MVGHSLQVSLDIFGCVTPLVKKGPIARLTRLAHTTSQLASISMNPPNFLTTLRISSYEIMLRIAVAGLFLKVPSRSTVEITQVANRAARATEIV